MNDNFIPNDKIVPAIIEHEGIKYVAVQFHVDTIDENRMLWTENEKLLQRIDKAIEYINNNLTISSILDGKKTYCLNDYSFNYENLLNILRGDE